MAKLLFILGIAIFSIDAFLSSTESTVMIIAGYSAWALSGLIAVTGIFSNKFKTPFSFAIDSKINNLSVIVFAVVAGIAKALWKAFTFWFVLFALTNN